MEKENIKSDVKKKKNQKKKSFMNIKDIAKKAGVSVATISYVVNNKPGVGAGTRKRILSLIEQEKFIPNMNSRRLTMKRSFNYYMAIDYNSPINNMFYSEILHEMTSACADSGYNVVLLNYTNDNISELITNIKIQGNADAFFFMHDIDEKAYNTLYSLELPFVVIDSHLKNAPYPTVRIDYELAMYTVTNYLIEQGHKDIAFVSTTRIPEYYMATFNGFKKVMEENNLSCNPEWIKSEAKDMESAYRCMVDILKTGSNPSAVVCAGDIFALACMNCAQRKGFQVPEEISFISIDDLAISKIFHPPLTTLRIDPQEMVKKAVESIKSQIALKKDPNILSFVLPSTNLMIRKSVLPFHK